MSRRLGQSGDGTATNRKSIALGLTVAMVAVVALSIPVGYVMAGSMGAGSQGQAGDGGLQTGTQGTYSVSQGENCTEVVPIASNDSVKAFYDYRTPFATNEYTNATGDSYSSEGTTDLQEPNTSVLFLYEGPTGNLSLVGVHGALNETSTGGAISFNVSGLSANGTWAVKDDEYDHESRIDNWSHDDGNASIDWTWGGARTDGFAFEGLGEGFNVTIEPAFNENATLFGEQYNGTVENWTVVSNVSNASEDTAAFGTTTTYNRTVLNMSQNVSVTPGACDALSSAAPTPAGAGANETDGPGGGAETPDEDDDAGDANQDDIDMDGPDDADDGDDADDTDGDDADDETDGDDADDADGDDDADGTNGDDTDDGTDDADDGDDGTDGDDDTEELDSIDLEIDWDTIGPGESIPVTVTADYGDSTEDVTGEAALSSSDDSIATTTGSEVEGVSLGEVQITATFEGESDTESVSVEPNESDGELEGVELIAGSTQLSPGGTTSLTVEAETQVGTQDVTGEAEITSDNSGVASVQGSTLQANGEGEATITADYLDGSDSVTVTVAGNGGDGGTNETDGETGDGTGDDAGDDQDGADTGDDQGDAGTGDEGNESLEGEQGNNETDDNGDGGAAGNPGASGQSGQSDDDDGGASEGDDSEEEENEEESEEEESEEEEEDSDEGDDDDDDDDDDDGGDDDDDDSFWDDVFS